MINLTQAFEQQLLDTGLIQFGRFHVKDHHVPFRCNFEMLPSYPELLDTLAHVVVSAFVTMPAIERLVCTADALPLGMAISLMTKIPLVYSRGLNTSAVHDLVGAYDVGHPTALITNLIDRDSDQDLALFKRRAESVGLHIVQTIGMFSSEHETDDEIAVLINARVLVLSLRQGGMLTAEVADQVLAWFNR